MKRTMIFALGVLLAGSAAAQAPTPFDGNWRGTSDGGSCNAPLDVTLNIESGIVDGTAYDTSAKGPVPNQRRRRPHPACGNCTASSARAAPPA